MKNNKGFTLGELLIVVAIIAVLVAVSVPVFAGKLEQSREAADLANLRSAYAEAAAQIYDQDADTVTISSVKLQSDGELEYIDVDDLPFSLPASFSFAKGSYSAVFDFSTDKPSVALTALP